MILAVLVFGVVNLVLGAIVIAHSPYFYDIVDWRNRRIGVGRLRKYGVRPGLKRVAWWYLCLFAWPVVISMAEKGRLRPKKLIEKK